MKTLLPHLAPQLLIDFRNNQDLSGWLSSEKLDGWRMIWTGREYLTRQGLAFPVPAAWLEGMPNCPLDGELFAGRGEFNSIRARMKNSWNGLKFHVFDAPSASPFHERASLLERMPLPGHCVRFEHSPIASTKEWKKQAWKISLEGGEGLVARNPLAPYKSGRDANILRFVPQDPNANRKNLL